MNRKAVYFHLVPFGLEKTVVDSQVIVPALALSKQGIPASLIVLESPLFLFSLLNSQVRKKIHRRLCGLSTTFLPRFPRNFFFLNTIMLAFFFFPFFIMRRRIIVQARGLQGTSFLLPLKKIFGQIRVIGDVRGIESEEYEYACLHEGKKRLSPLQKEWKDQLDIISRKSLLEADVKFCVSKAMLVHLQQKVQASDRDRWEYVPCSVDVAQFSSILTDRDRQRNEKGLQNRLVVVYSGAYRAWQMPERTIQIYKKIKNLAPQAFFLCLTPDVTEFSEALQKQGIGSQESKVERVNFDEMGRTLVCGDIGLLLREENPINTYACPTKFAEYLACGLFVVATPAVHDVAQAIATEGVGYLLHGMTDSPGLESELQKIIQLSSDAPSRIAKSVAAAQALYDWSGTIPSLKKWYLRLSTES